MSDIVGGIETFVYGRGKCSALRLLVLLLLQNLLVVPLVNQPLPLLSRLDDRKTSVIQSPAFGHHQIMRFVPRALLRVVVVVVMRIALLVEEEFPCRRDLQRAMRRAMRCNKQKALRQFFVGLGYENTYNMVEYRTCCT